VKGVQQRTGVRLKRELPGDSMAMPARADSQDRGSRGESDLSSRGGRGEYARQGNVWKRACGGVKDEFGVGGGALWG
jgi:hypothetical protein